MIDTKVAEIDLKMFQARDWKLEIFGCPSCKEALNTDEDIMYCPSCRTVYQVDNGVPVLLGDQLKAPLFRQELPVKSYYLNERYDWTRDPKGLEYCYHHYRKWETWSALRKFLEPESLVLDVGCGTGLITSILSRNRYRTVALDLNRWALFQMNGKPYVAKAQADAESLPVQDESVDLVIATEVIEHLEEPGRTAEEMLRVTRPGGHIIGSVPNRHPLWNMRRQLSISCPGDEPFHRNFTRREIAELWQEAGRRAEISAICLGMNWLWIIQK